MSMTCEACGLELDPNATRYNNNDAVLCRSCGLDFAVTVLQNLDNPIKYVDDWMAYGKCVSVSRADDLISFLAARQKPGEGTRRHGPSEVTASTFCKRKYYGVHDMPCTCSSEPRCCR